MGEYQNLIIDVLADSDNTETYVQEEIEGVHKELKVPSEALKLGGFTDSAESSQTFVVEFGLRHAMTDNPGPDRYILKPTGVRVVRLADVSHISGNVELTASCALSDDESLSHVAYLYEGHELDTALLGDVFDPELDTDVPENIIVPAVATSIEDNGDYLFPYLNAGDYTVAISCNAPEDNAADYDEIVIPSPEGHLVELTLATETNMECDFVEGLEVTCEETALSLD